jgi:energy-coupling factor transporter ATP-binding protein EcfA2
VLLSFRTANYRSIRDELVLTMRRDKRMSPASGQSEVAQVANNVAAIYGSNASGKSSVLSALALMSELVSGSSDRRGDTPLRYEPFILDDYSKSVPTLLEVEIQRDSVRYQYGFTFNSGEIVNEWLYAYPYGRRQVWFERSLGDNQEYRFGKSLAGRNRVIADLTRPDALFLSTAAKMNHEQLAVIIDWFANGLVAVDSKTEQSRFVRTMRNIHDSPGNLEALLALLKFSDIGIRGLELVKEDIDPKVRSRALEFLRIVSPEDFDGQAGVLSDTLDKLPNFKIRLRHERGDGSPPVALPFEAESLGTRSLVALGGVILAALKHGHVLVVDEIDTSLHPKLVAELVGLFQSAATNRGGAQLIFTSHDVSLLDGAGSDDVLLRRDQIWFTEKNAQGATGLYPLTDFHPRKLENLERGYLQGRYGAVPFIDRDELPGLQAENS